MTTLYAILTLIVLLSGMGYWLNRRGRRLERGAAATASNAVKDDQLEAAANAPKSTGELVERIRKSGW